MSPVRVLFLLILILVMTAVPAGAFDDTSFRIRSIGAELNWIVPDEYTDIQMNPLAMKEMDSTLLITNLSNLGNDDHAFLVPNLVHQGTSGSFLAGGFWRMGGRHVGIVGEYWRAKEWRTLGRRMDINFSGHPEFDWSWNAYTTIGTLIFDEDNETETQSDDYRIVDRTTGTAQTRDREGMDLKVFLGGDDLGLAYRLTRSSSRAPNYGAMENLSHSYELLEIGMDSPEEAVSAIQSQTEEYDRTTTRHVLQAGWAWETDQKGNLDLVGGLIYQKEKTSNDERYKKKVDFDPDHDGISHATGYYSRYYDQYQMQGHDFSESDLDGFGFDLKARYSRPLNARFTIRALGELSYVALEDPEFQRVSAFQENMEVFEGGEAYSNYTRILVSGSEKHNQFHSLVGVGGTYSPEPGLLVAFACKWHHYYEETLRDATVYDGETTKPDAAESRYTLDDLMIPLGFEYTVKDRYAFRLGTRTSFHSYLDERSNTGSSTTSFFSFSDFEDTRAQTSETRTETVYTYGFGLKPNESLQLDIAAVTDLVDLSTYMFSCLLRF